MINKRYEELFDLRAEDVIGKTDEDFMEDKAQVRRLVKNDALVVERGRPVQFEEKVAYPEGVRSYVSMKFPMRDLDGEIYAVGGISTDITERKEAEEELQKLNQELMQTHENLTRAHEQLIQAEKMESVGRFGGGCGTRGEESAGDDRHGLELLAGASRMRMRKPRKRSLG